ncbi:FecR family protein [Sphingomonas colocasiae]|uniref:FecR family protein n=1 Tax=Sphingomonas colocasiae TaxID=1848973 RepID=A0ABS7PPZ0_9SPHN|nr:FecR family protein [Sphingomonas colocasiae]MBY8823333.1 FecR family protein [Sphingomonas colocasiae]
MGHDPEDEARDWLVRMNSGSVADADRAAFERWHADPEHAAAYAELEHVWALMMQSAGPADNIVTFTGRPRRFERFRAHWARNVAAIAASLAVLALGAQQYATVWRFDHATQGSARGHVPLADGSTVELNTGSAIDIDYRDGERHVTLARGEAFFDVKRDPARPFVIGAGAGEVRVLGTAFSVKREGDGARVTVIRGRVRVTGGDGRSVELVPDQQAAFGNGNALAVAKVDAATALAWSRGQLVFVNRPLGEILSEIDRYYPGALFLVDEKAGRQRMNATINLDRIDDWVMAIAKSQKIRARRLPGAILVG